MRLLAPTVNLALWIAVLFAPAGHAQQQQRHRKLRPRYPLPARAKIVVGNAYGDFPADDWQHQACEELHPTPAHIRWLFNSNYEIDGMERHGGLDIEIACGVTGTIIVDGKTFSWQLQYTDPPGVLETSWPDGREKMLAHRLADLSDDPQPHRISRYVDRTWPH